MNFDWKTWCRFCGNSENNVKYEITVDIEHYFKISDQSPKICQQCSDKLNDFQEFVLKTENINQVFEELANEKELNHYKINQIREKYDLEVLEFELEDYTNSLLELNIKEDLSSGCEQNFEEDYQEDRLKTEKHENRKSKKSLSWNPGESKQRKLKTSKQKSKDEKNFTESKEKGHPRKVFKTKFLPKDKIIPPICHVCNKKFTTVKFLEEHTLSEHDCGIQLPCVCGHVITKYEHFYNHRKRCCAVVVAPHKCDLCGNNYATKYVIEKHMNEKHRVDSVKHKCPTCNRQFKFSYQLKKHETVHLPEELRKIFRCSLCEKRYATKGQLKYHVMATHETNVEKNFTCHLCAKSYTTKSILRKHFESHVTTLNFQCNICSKRCKTENLLKNHQKSHQERKYFCEVCNMAFKRSTTRNQHMITHTDERPYSCPNTSCNLKFKRREEADTHNNRVHLGNKRYLCRVCGSDFNYIKDRLEHMRILHPQEYLEYNEKYQHLRKEFQPDYEKISFGQN